MQSMKSTCNLCQIFILPILDAGFYLSSIWFYLFNLTYFVRKYYLSATTPNTALSAKQLNSYIVNEHR